MDTPMHALVDGGLIHRDAYADPEIFKLEHEMLFRRTWLYVGHESQFASPGDYYSTTLANEPILIVRGEDGQPRAFFNRCTHRGAVIARRPQGKARNLQCAYHGWSFKLDGSLNFTPLMQGYEGSDVQTHADTFALKPVPRFASYRGFYFASLAPEGQELEDFLGPVAVHLANMVERSPTGEIEVWGGVFRMIKRNNWKVYLENLHDGAHALSTHSSSIRAAQSIIESTTSEWTQLQAYIIAANSQPPSAMAQIAVNCFGSGHSNMMAFRKTRPDNPGQREYEDALAKRVGRDGVEEILGVDCHNAIIYPTLSLQPNWMQLRLIVPLDVNTTRVDVWTFQLKGAPDWINRRIQTYANTIHTPASLVRADDLENFERVQIGLQARSVPWVSAHRGIANEGEPQGKSTAMSERYVRNQFDAWSKYMKGAL